MIDSDIKARVDLGIDSIVQKNIEKAKIKKPKIEFDRLKMYFGRPFTVTENLTIYERTIGAIIDYGEKPFFEMLNRFISHTTQFRLPLQKMGIDWNKKTDFQLFASLTSVIPIDKTNILFGDIDFTKFQFYEKPLTEEQIQENKDHKGDKNFIMHKPEECMINADQQILIQENDYNVLVTYLRTMFNIFPKVEKAKGRETKKSLIEEDMDNLALAMQKNESDKSFLLPLISSCLNHPGFKYKKSELEEVGIVEFMDSVQRLQIIASTNALMYGMYSGFCDMSKVDKSLFNFMRDISND